MSPFEFFLLKFDRVGITMVLRARARGTRRRYMLNSGVVVWAEDVDTLTVVTFWTFNFEVRIKQEHIPNIQLT